MVRKKPSRKLQIKVALLNIVPWTLIVLVILVFGSYVPKNALESALIIASAFGLGIPAVLSVLVDVGYYFEYCTKNKEETTR